MVLKNFTDPYSIVEAFVYDAFIAPALTDHVDQISVGITDSNLGRARVLDVGCGGGQNAIELLDRNPLIELTGLDLSQAQVGRASSRSKRFHNRSRFIQGDALDLPFEDNSFDIVYSIASIKHWPDKKRGLAECVRVLKEGGRLFIIEGDRSASWSDCRNFVEKWRLPVFTLPVNLYFFKNVVIANALDPKDAEVLAEGLNLDQAAVQKVKDLPAILLSGMKKPVPS